MGLIKAGIGALGGTLADQWKEFFYCESIPKETNYKKSSPKMKIVQKNAPPLTNSIQMLNKTSEGDGESKTTKPECALVLKNCSICMLRFVKAPAGTVCIC